MDGQQPDEPGNEPSLNPEQWLGLPQVIEVTSLTYEQMRPEDLALVATTGTLWMGGSGRVVEVRVGQVLRRDDFPGDPPGPPVWQGEDELPDVLRVYWEHPPDEAGRCPVCKATNCARRRRATEVLIRSGARPFLVIAAPDDDQPAAEASEPAEQSPPRRSDRTRPDAGRPRRPDRG